MMFLSHSNPFGFVPGASGGGLTSEDTWRPSQLEGVCFLVTISDRCPGFNHRTWSGPTTGLGSWFFDSLIGVQHQKSLARGVPFHVWEGDFDVYLCIVLIIVIYII